MIVDAKAAGKLEGQLKYWAYNALDCTGTREVADTLLPRLDPQTERTYAFERAMQNPALAMMRRGLRVDEQRRADAINVLNRELKKLTTAVNKLPVVKEVWDGMEKETGVCPKGEGKRHKWPRGEPDETRCCTVCGTARIKRRPFNPQSPDQSKRLFYNLHSLPELRNKTGIVSVDEDILGRIGKKWPKFAPLTELMLEIRNVKKQIGFLSAKLTPGGRYPSSFNVGAAWTGRWSSSKNPFGLGGNLQNVAERHRNIFLPDAGWELVYADLEQAESRVVAYLSGDEGYIRAHDSGNVHVAVARLIWPGLPWTGDMVADKVVAKTPVPWVDAPGHDYYRYAKVFQHGCNYGMMPSGVSLHAHVPLSVAKAAYYAYHDAFPYIRAWHGSIKEEVKNGRPLTNPLGRRIRLFGRPWDEHTFKQGLSFKPQSTVADILNLGLWGLWYHHDPAVVQVLAQVHDAVLCQWPHNKRQEGVEAVKSSLHLPFPVVDYQGIERECTIPVEIMVGKNWGKRSSENPQGMTVI